MILITRGTYHDNEISIQLKMVLYFSLIVGTFRTGGFMVNYFYLYILKIGFTIFLTTIKYVYLLELWGRIDSFMMTMGQLFLLIHIKNLIHNFSNYYKICLSLNGIMGENW